MAVKLLSYCAVLFLGMMLFLIIKEPYTLNRVGLDGNLVPEIELFNATNYQIKQGSIESIVVSQRVARYKELDRLYVINAQHKTKEGLLGNITSDEAVLQNNVISFLQNSHYKREDGFGLSGEEIKYALNQKILSSDKPFVFYQKDSRTVGDSFVYQMKEGTIAGDNIRSVIQQVGKK